MRSLLIVDDDVRLGSAIAMRLRGAGFQVTRVERGDAAVECARNTCPSAIILDIRLPDIDGFEVCRRIRAVGELASTPVIFLSANSSRSDRASAAAAGATTFLAKPCQAADLIGTIHQLIGQRDSMGASAGSRVDGSEDERNGPNVESD